jgi:hypothetical protein
MLLVSEIFILSPVPKDIATTVKEILIANTCINLNWRSGIK